MQGGCVALPQAQGAQGRLTDCVSPAVSMTSSEAHSQLRP